MNKVLLDKQLNQTGDEEYQFVDGMLLKVTGPPGMKGWSITGTRRFSPANGFTGLGLEGFGDAGNPFSYDQETGTIGIGRSLCIWWYRHYSEYLSISQGAIKTCSC